MNLLMSLRRFWRSGSGRRPGRVAPRRPSRALLRLEALEDRLVLSDSTGASTVLVKDILAGSATSSPIHLTDVNGKLFFAASDGASGVELWKSDGTAAGTVLVKDINPGGAGSYPNELTNVNGTLYFLAYDGAPGVELWKSDGTAAGTVLVKDIGPGYAEHLTDVDGTVFFVAYDPTYGEELWKSDGTAAGTVLIKDINPGNYPDGPPRSSHPYQLTNVNGLLFFDANDGTHGWELWKSDGTAAGTVLVKDINPEVYPGGGSAAPYELTNVNGTLFFRANDGTRGWELWKSDGTAAGTVLVKDLYPGAGGSYPGGLANVNGTLFFTAYDVKSSSHGLWKSDGTSAGTVLVKSGVSAWQITNVSGTAFFTGDDGKNGAELWKSDGTSRGTVLVNDIYTGSTTTWHTCYYYCSGRKKWKVTNPNSSDPGNLLNVNGTLFFVATNGTTGVELWKSDGTATGTVLVKDINPGNASSNPASLTVSGGHLFFSADDGVHGRELWDPPISSGSITGTALEDLTDNGISADDATIQGRVIHLLRDNGDGTFNTGSDTLVANQTTGRDGSYVFRQLSAGTYFVQQELPLGWVQTAPEEHRDDVIIRPPDCGQTPPERNDTLATAVATGLSSATPGTYIACGEIGDNNFHELDVDLFRVQLNAADFLQADIDAAAFGSSLDSVLRIFDATGHALAGDDDAIGGGIDSHVEWATTSTGTYYVGVSGTINGSYNPLIEGSGFFAQSTGEYTIEITVGPRPRPPIAVTLAQGENRTGVDLASLHLGAITGQMFDDVNGNGQHDAGEPGIDGQRVNLTYQGTFFGFDGTRSIDLNQDGTIDPTTESGWYSFEGLRPGIYFVRTRFSFGLGTPGLTQVSPSLDPSQLPCIGQVPRGTGSDPGPGLEPDLTVDLVHGLCDRFQTGDFLYFGQATPNIGLGPMELRGGADLGNGPHSGQCADGRGDWQWHSRNARRRQGDSAPG